MTLPHIMMTHRGKMNTILCEVGYLILMWILDAMDFRHFCVLAYLLDFGLHIRFS